MTTIKCPDCGHDATPYGMGAYECSECTLKFDKAVAPDSPLAVQEGGGHYKDLAIQPVQYIHANGLGFIEGCVIKYVSRHRAKNGLEDLQKARHFIDLLIELEYGDE